jgi:hypothetical protein
MQRTFGRLKKNGLAGYNGNAARRCCQHAHAWVDIDTGAISRAGLHALRCLSQETTGGFAVKQASGKGMQASGGQIVMFGYRVLSNYGVRPIAWIISSLAWT